MNKQDWIEYFEAINGRTPSPEEEAQALAAGEFVADSPVEAVAPAQPQVAEQAPVEQAQEAPAPQAAEAQFAPANPAANFQEPAQGLNQAPAQDQFQAATQAQAFQQAPVQGQVAADAQAFQQAQAGQFNQAQGQFAQGQQFYQQAPNGQFQMPAVPKQPNPVGQAFKDFFAWFLQGFKNPQAKSEDSHLAFGLITVGLASWFMAWGVDNFFHRLLMAYSIPSYRSETFRDTYRQAVSSHFGVLKTFLLLLIFFILYTVLTVLPVLFNKDKEKSFFTKVGQYFSYTPILLVLNLLSFVTTWFVPGKITKQSAASFYEYVVGKYFQPLDVLRLGQKVSSTTTGFESVHIIVIIMMTLFVIGFTMILVSLIKNLDFSLGKVNSFYITLAVTLLFALLMVGLNKTISASLHSGFDSIHDVFNNSDSSDYDDSDYD